MPLTQQTDLDVLHDLTHREADVLRLMAEGLSNEAIAQQLFVSSRTVESHIANIFNKLYLMPAVEDNRRVKAVLTYLSCRGATTSSPW